MPREPALLLFSFAVRTLLEGGSVSALEEKLAEAEVSPGTRARRPLSTLSCCRGYQVLAGSEGRPLRVSITPMDETSVWARVPGLRHAFEKELGPTGLAEGEPWGRQRE